ncbi:MAG: trypsin-like peptidase domain-containing protein [Sedimentisphaerales bacterium]|nr:trypsin-like peptidase domain-containing protein [Sedimentisphaerales bacterium]
MRTMRNLALILVISSALVSQTLAARIVLQGGAEVVGDILREDDQVLVVDLGVAVLRLERENVEFVVSETEDDAEQQETQAASVTEDEFSAWQLYRTADLPVASIESNSERIGEAVVMVRSPGGQGSGFIINPEGYLITNYHVIARETEIRVVVFRKTETGFEQENYRRVRIVALNPFVDLALLKIEDADREFEYVYFGDMDAVEVGNEVFAIGNPLGLTRTVSQGIVSSRNRNFEGRLYIQTTTDINPGNSGGPLFDNRGQVIGVTSMGYIFLGGLNFAIPVDVVKRFIDNRDAFAYDSGNPNNGHRYLQPAPRRNKDLPAIEP